MILTESLQVETYEIDKEVKMTLRAFQEVLKILYEAYHEGGYKGDKRGRLDSPKKLQELRKTLKRYHNYPFIDMIAQRIESTYNEYVEATKAVRQTKKQMPQIQQGIDKILAAWKTHNPAKIRQATEFAREFAQNARKASKRDEVLKYGFNPVYHENPLFLRSARFLEVFEQSEIERAMNLDLDEYRYAYLKLPNNKHTDYQYLAYFLLNLQNSPGEVELSNTKLKKYFDMAFSNEEYAELTKLVEGYLSQNKKENIPLIVEKIKQFPEIQEANERSKEKYDRVFRGIGIHFDEEEGSPPSEQEVLDRDRESRFVATSDDYDAALNFAYSRGHLMSRDTRNNDLGYIIIYDVTPEAIILDTSIFGGIFNESEIVIDVSKASVKEIIEV